MRKQQWFAISVCTVVVVAASAGNAFAGEVKGPPGTVDNTNFNAAPENANSNCAYSGLNDLELDGQNDSQVQTAAMYSNTVFWFVQSR